MKRNVGFMVLLLLVAVIFPGCSKSAKESDYIVYEFNVDSTALVEVSYNTDTENIDKLVDELITELSTGSADASYLNAIPSNVTVLDKSISNGVLKLSFGPEYSGQTPVSEVMTRAAIVKTLTQIEGIDSVEFIVSDELLKDSDGNVVGNITGDEFKLSTDVTTSEEAETDAVFYVASADGQSLVQESRHLSYNSDVPIARVLIENLQKQPKTDDTRIPIAEKTSLKSIAVADGVCYITFDSVLLSQSQSVSTDVMIYSIVDTLTELDSINKVQISIDRENSDLTLSLNNIDGLYDRDISLVQE